MTFWLFAFNPGVFYPNSGELIMEGESRHHKVTKLETEKTALAGKSKLFGRLESLEASYRSLDHSKKEIEAYSKALDDELENGRQFQKNFLPDNIPRLPNWEIATYFAPAKQVSGDFYDIFPLYSILNC